MYKFETLLMKIFNTAPIKILDPYPNIDFSESIENSQSGFHLTKYHIKIINETDLIMD
jgi:hypothetical protein